MRNECTFWCLKFRNKRIRHFGGRSIRNFFNGIFWPEIGQKWAKIGRNVGPKWAKLRNIGDGCVFCGENVAIGVFRSVDDDPDEISARKSIKTSKNAKK